MSESQQKVERRHCTDAFQLEAVRMADPVGLNAAAGRLGVPRATVGNWACRRRKVVYPAAGTAMAVAAPASTAALKRPAAELEGEIARLRCDLASLKVDNEILRKAAAYFARGSR